MPENARCRLSSGSRSAGGRADVPRSSAVLVVEGQLAESTVREQIDSYIEYESPQDVVGTKRRLDKPLPELQLSTQSLMLTLPISITQGVATTESEALLSGLHTLKYALTSLFPLELLCDRGDLGVLSTPHTRQQVRARSSCMMFILGRRISSERL